MVRAKSSKLLLDGNGSFLGMEKGCFIIRDRNSKVERYPLFEKEISEVRKALPHNVILKVIIEAGCLEIGQQVEATKAVINSGAQFVKTCTGFFGGATVEQVRTLCNAAGGQIEVKASGGIRTLAQCRQLLEAGATRLGSSASVAIMQELLQQ